MWYVVLGEAVAIVALWGAWRHKRAALKVAEDALTTMCRAAKTAAATHEDQTARYEKEIAALRKELSVVYEALDANATPESVRADLDRLLSR